MATGDDHRIGAANDRAQIYNLKTEQWVKRNSVKQDGKPFKGITKGK